MVYLYINKINIAGYIKIIAYAAANPVYLQQHTYHKQQDSLQSISPNRSIKTTSNLK
jgi:hypothetical protein